METIDRPSQTAGELARSVASAAVEATPAVTPTELELETPQVLEQTPVEPAPVEPAPVPAEPVPVEPTPATAPEAIYTAEEADQAYISLREMGIDLGVRRSELPPEVHGAYDAMVGTVIRERTEALQQQVGARDAVMQVQDFAQKLQENPKQVILTMALQNSEAFADVLAEWERMQEDSGYAETVRKEIAAEAMMATAKRQMQMHTQQQLETRAQQVRSHTLAVAQKLGANPEASERMVAAKIMENNGNITAADIEEAVRAIAPATPPTRTKTPAQVAAEKAAPTEPLAGTGQTPTGTETTPTEPQTHVRTGLRSLIKDAAKRIDSSRS